MTASFGCATLDAQAVLRRVKIPDLVVSADAALYCAKHAGRNRVEQGTFELPVDTVAAPVQGSMAAAG